MIKDDFYELCFDFFDGHVNLESINTSFITIISKINNPETMNDFRRISLLNCSIELLTKILADRLQKVIIQLLHKINMVSSKAKQSRTVFHGVLSTSINAIITRNK